MKTSFKTITIGEVKDYKKELENKGIYISSYAQDLIEKTPLSKEKETLDLVILTPREMGFEDWDTTKQIFDKAEELGYQLCPAEAGLALRLAYEGKDWLIVGMEAVTGRGGCPSVFRLRAVGAELELNTDYGRSDRRWIADCQFVFCLRKSLSPSETSDPLENLDTLTPLGEAIKVVKEAGYKVIKEL